MWDCLVKFSTWAEGNSGQIQIVIAFVALGLAIFGFKQIIEQIKISKKQEEMTIEQMDFNLKIISLNTMINAIENNHKTQQELYELKRILENEVQAADDEDEKIRLELIEDLNTRITRADDLRITLIKTCKTYGSLKNRKIFHEGELLDLSIRTMLSGLERSQTYDLIKRSIRKSVD